MAKLRGTYKCYSWYLKGDPTSPQIRLRISSTRVLDTMDPEVASRLPASLVFPIDDQNGMRAMVDAVLECDTRTLKRIANESPGFELGFEHFLKWVERHQVEMAHQAVAETFKAPLDKTPEHVEFLTRTPVGKAVLDFSVLRFKDGDAWGELKIAHQGTLLTRALMDLSSQAVTLSHHHPGRYRARGWDDRRYLRIIGCADQAGRLVMPVKPRKVFSQAPIR